MPVLSSPSRGGKGQAPPLPVSNSILSRNGIWLRRGQFSLMAAAPGVGKSVFATNLAVHTKVPAIYFSADSDEWTVRTRVTSVLTGVKLATVEEQMQQEAWETYYTQQLQHADHVDWCYATDIETDFIQDRLMAHAEMRGIYPELIVVDNLGNTVEEQGDEYAELRRTCRELQRIARTTKAHVLALHHVVGKKEDGREPIELSDLIGKIGKVSEQVFGLSRNSDTELLLTIPKNRGGRSGYSVALPIDYSSSRIGGY